MATDDLSIEQRVRRMAPVAAPPAQQTKVEALARLLDRVGQPREQEASYQLMGPGGDSVPLPQMIVTLLERVTELLAQGEALSVVPVGRELTTQQAADLLNVSRQYVVRLLDAGRIPHSKVGKHRRVLARDVVAFKRERDRDRAAAMSELTSLSEEVGGYEELR